MKDHETMRNEQADRELDLRAKLIRAKQEHDRDREFRPTVVDGNTLCPVAQQLHRHWKLA